MNLLPMFYVLPGIALAACSATVINVGDFGVTPGTADATPGVRRALEEASRCEGGAVINFPAGTYHFHPEDAQVHKLYVSNHDQPVNHRVGIPLVGLKNCTINANGAHFVFHGDMMPVLIQDSLNTTCQDFSISYATPFSAEGRIISTEGGRTVLEFPEDPQVNPPWKVVDGRFTLNGENGPHVPNTAIIFREDGMIVPTGKAGDVYWTGRARHLGGNRVEFAIDARSMGYSVGDTVVLRNENRPHPAMALYRASNTELHNIVFHDSQGMALLAQRSVNVHVDGGGCLCPPGRVHSVSADACHFSNCRGEVVVENATFEGMMDDAINVHATSLRIEGISKDRRRLELRYCHRQAYGFETFRKGEKLRFIHADSLENVPATVKVTAVETPSPTRVTVTLDSPAPKDIKPGDAVENADWHPGVTFRNNTVRNNRARGALFTTPKHVLVEGNEFIHSSGSAILLAGDAAGWYESGSCRDVVIRNNVFDHNLTCSYQFTRGIISICPQVNNPAGQKKRYHRNVRIEGNTFRTHQVPLLYAMSADNVTLRGNTVEFDDAYPAMGNGKPYIVEHCGKMNLQRIKKSR